jgi:hypothetical protein
LNTVPFALTTLRKRFDAGKKDTRESLQCQDDLISVTTGGARVDNRQLDRPVALVLTKKSAAIDL